MKKIMSQGVYTLIIKNSKEQDIQIGKLGNFLFPEGFYIYIGSALGKTATNLENRLKRHLSSTKKLFAKPHSEFWCFRLQGELWQSSLLFHAG
jgi:Uri superfamily endonuclease